MQLFAACGYRLLPAEVRPSVPASIVNIDRRSEFSGNVWLNKSVLTPISVQQAHKRSAGW